MHSVTKHKMKTGQEESKKSRATAENWTTTKTFQENLTVLINQKFQMEKMKSININMHVSSHYTSHSPTQ